MSDERKWTALLTGEHNGLIHEHGSKFHGSPEYYERIDVVPMSILSELQERVAELDAENKRLKEELKECGHGVSGESCPDCIKEYHEDEFVASLQAENIWLTRKAGLFEKELRERWEYRYSEIADLLLEDK